MSEEATEVELVAALTVRAALPVLPASVPVTVWAPATLAVQLVPTRHEPSGLIVKVVTEVTSPRSLLKTS